MARDTGHIQQLANPKLSASDRANRLADRAMLYSVAASYPVFGWDPYGGVLTGPDGQSRKADAESLREASLADAAEALKFVERLEGENLYVPQILWSAMLADFVLSAKELELLDKNQVSRIWYYQHATSSRG